MFHHQCPSCTQLHPFALFRCVEPLRTQTHCTPSRFDLPIHLYIHIYVQMHTTYVHTCTPTHVPLLHSVNRVSTNAASFNLMRNRLLRSVHTLLEMKYVKQKADRFVSRYVVLCTDRTRWTCNNRVDVHVGYRGMN